ncbi:MAG: P-loop domain-containing protein, partial [Myxococcota bacterium]
ESGAHPTYAPEASAVELSLSNGSTLRGLGVRQGVTLIVGGGYHGKSTLLAALARGVYDHVTGDGRERVVSLPDAVKLRAEDGRSVTQVDISPFIGTLPGGRTTREFSTDDASGSTSQAAALIEALELGSSALLLDEDTSATNFLIRDARMAALVPSDQEPITPLLDRIDWLRAQRVSLVMVVGGSGDYFETADSVLALRDYAILDVTEEARTVVKNAPQSPRPEVPPVSRRLERRVDVDSLDARRGRREHSTKVRDIDRVSFGETELDLAALEQLVEPGQTRFVAELLAQRPEPLRTSSVADALAEIEREIEGLGLAALQPTPDGEWVRARRYEIGAALNRLRGIRLTIESEDASR